MSCPICHREHDPKYSPFCSRRCSEVDLGRWLTGAYAVPEAAQSDDASSDFAEQDSASKPH